MELNASRGSVGAEDYSLITKEKCNPPRAKLFIVFLVSLVVATVIVLLVVLTRLDAPKDGIVVTDPDSCMDVAIIGAGLAGSYAAWRLSEKNRSVRLYEATSRVGGRFYTDDSDKQQRLELGAGFYSPILHSLLDKLLARLDINTKKVMSGLDVTQEDVYYLRGQDLSLAGVQSPYTLDKGETNKEPLELLWHLLGGDKVVDNTADENSTQKQEPTWREYVNSQRLDHLLQTRGSYEAYLHLRDTLKWWEYDASANANIFLEYQVQRQGYGEFSMAERRTLVGGMTGLVNKLIQEATANNPRFQLKTNHELEAIESESYGHFLHFRRAYIISADEDELCAKHVIITLPPSALSDVTTVPSEIQETWDPLLDNIDDVPLYRVFLEYVTSDPPWDTAPWAHLRTNLPINDVTYRGISCVITQPNDGVTDEPPITDYAEWKLSTDGPHNSSTGYDRPLRECSTVWEVNFGEQQEDYWIGLLTLDGYQITDHVMQINMTSSKKFVTMLTHYLQTVIGNKTDMTYPSKVRLVTWRRDVSTEAFHVWKPGVNWTTAADNIRRPIKDVTIDIAGAAYARGHLQYWAEGALNTINTVINKLKL